MNGAMFAVTLAAAITGGGAAYLAWAIVSPLLGPKAPRAAAQPPASPAADVAPGPAPAAEVPMFPDPSLGAQIAAVRTDMAALARAQISLLEGMAERESQLLNEMRAVASVRDPELLKSLQRIEARLSGRPPPEDGTLLTDETEQVPPSDTEEAMPTIGRA